MVIQRLAVFVVSAFMLMNGMSRVWAEASSAQLPYAPDQLIVKFKSHVSEANKQKFLAEIHAQPIKSLAAVRADVIHVDSSRSISKWVQTLEYHPWVEYVEPDYKLNVNAAAPAIPLPNDSLFNYLWGLNNSNQFAGSSSAADIDAPEAWKIYRPAATIVVAVIDTGVDYTHPDLAANVWVNTLEDINRDGKLTKDDLNGKDDDNNGLVDDVIGWNFNKGTNNAMDDNGHGTHVAGTIAAGVNNKVGVAGVAGQGYVKIMPLKFLAENGSGYVSDAVGALTYATQKGARIVNASWGGGGYSQAFLAAMQQFQASGGLFVAAAGNNSSNNDKTPHYPASYNLANEIAVASLGYNNLMSGFSNYGTGSVAMAAPGYYIASTWPNNQYALLSGTSMAAPHVSGVAALLWSQRGGSINGSQLRTLLMNTVQKNAALNKYTKTGGVVNAKNALSAK
jgi:subtilisin family serine protease